MNNGQQRKEAGKKQQKENTQKRKKRAKLVFIIAELFVLAILAVILYGVSKLNKINRPGNEIMDQVEVNDDIKQEVLEVTENFRTIAVFGLDNRSNGNFDSGNSDVIIIVAINNETHEVKMCSVYRDTYLDIGDGKFRKCNAAFAKGGPQAAISMLNKNLDLNITDYVTVDFNAVVECIDLLGGIELTITDAEAHYMIGYVEGLNEQTGNTSEVPETGGTYILDGVQATAYARIRQTEGSDYKRTERQRTIIAKMLDKVQQSDLKTVNLIIDAMFEDIETSFSNAELISLAAKIFDYELAGSAGFPFSKNSIELGSKGSVVAPCTLESNVMELHKFLYNNDEYVPSATVKANSEKIESDTGFSESDGF